MAKNRPNRKQVRRMKQKAAVSTATQVRLIVEQFSHQSQLDTFLLQCEDTETRKRLYDFVLPFLKFPNPRFPTTLATPGIILP